MINLFEFIGKEGKSFSLTDLLDILTFEVLVVNSQSKIVSASLICSYEWNISFHIACSGTLLHISNIDTRLLSCSGIISLAVIPIQNGVS